MTLFCRTRPGHLAKVAIAVSLALTLGACSSDDGGGNGDGTESGDEVSEDGSGDAESPEDAQAAAMEEMREQLGLPPMDEIEPPTQEELEEQAAARQALLDELQEAVEIPDDVDLVGADEDRGSVLGVHGDGEVGPGLDSMEAALVATGWEVLERTGDDDISGALYLRRDDELLQVLALTAGDRTTLTFVYSLASGDT